MTISRLSPLALLLAVLPGVLPAQSVSSDFRGGVYTQPRGMGTSRGTQGSLSTVPSAAFGVDARSPGAVFGARLSGVFGALTGSHFSQTSCTGCGAHSLVTGGFAGLALDLTAQQQSERWTLRLGVGPGVVNYYFGDQAFLELVCPSGSICDDYFRHGDTRAALHTGATVAWAASSW